MIGGHPPKKSILLIVIHTQRLLSKYIPLIERALAMGYDIEMLCPDPGSRRIATEILGADGDRVRVIECNRLISRILLARSSRRLVTQFVVRIALRFLRLPKGIVGAFTLRPTDIVSYALARRLPLISLTGQQGNENWEQRRRFHGYYGDRKDLSIIERIALSLDRLTGGKLYPRLGETVAVKRAEQVLADFFFGLSPTPAIMGQGGEVYVCVGGRNTKEYLTRLGVAPEKITISGRLDIEQALKSRRHFDAEAKSEFLSSLSLPKDAKIIGFFSEGVKIPGIYLDFDEFDNETIAYIKSLRDELKDHYIVFKHHPHFAHNGYDYDRFRSRLVGEERVVVVEEFIGDDFNTKLILSSDVLISLGTLCITAAALNKVCLGYPMGYVRHIPAAATTFGTCFVFESPKELAQAAKRIIFDGAESHIYGKLQLARERYIMPSPELSAYMPSEICLSLLENGSMATAGTPANNRKDYRSGAVPTRDEGYS